MCVLTGNHHPLHHAFFFLRQDQTRRQQGRQIVTTPVETNRNPSLIVRVARREILSVARNREALSRANDDTVPGNTIISRDVRVGRYSCVCIR